MFLKLHDDANIFCINNFIFIVLYFSSLAALGLIENNAPNITAAMLVSPLMGPVMSITFGAIISDRELVVKIYSYLNFMTFV